MVILAHRANLNGPQATGENSLAATARALASGFGVETDLRRDGQGRYYIAHDAVGWSPDADFESFAKLFRSQPDRCVALNVKEFGYLEALLARQRAGDFGGDSFLFDFELLEPHTPGQAQRLIRALPEGDRAILAARVSDRGESLAQALAIPAQVVWLDEFDGPWATAEDVARLHAAGRRVFAVSPELHGAGDHARRRRWTDFKCWPLAGLCTDFALEARGFFASVPAS